MPVTCDRRSDPQPTAKPSRRYSSYLPTFQALSVLGRRAVGAAGMTDFHCICQPDVCIHPILYFHAQGSWVHVVAYPGVMHRLHILPQQMGRRGHFCSRKNGWCNTPRRAKRHSLYNSAGRNNNNNRVAGVRTCIAVAARACPTKPNRRKEPPVHSTYNIGSYRTQQKVSCECVLKCRA